MSNLTLANLLNNQETDAVQRMLENMNKRTQEAAAKAANGNEEAKRWLTFFFGWDEGKLFHLLWPVTRAMSLPVHKAWFGNKEHPDTIFPAKICVGFFGDQCDYCKKSAERLEESKKIRDTNPAESTKLWKASKDLAAKEYSCLPIFSFNSEVKVVNGKVQYGEYDPTPSSESGYIQVLFEETPMTLEHTNYIGTLYDLSNNGIKLDDPNFDRILTRNKVSQSGPKGVINRSRYDLASIPREKPFVRKSVEGAPKNHLELLLMLVREKARDYVGLVEQMIEQQNGNGQQKAATASAPTVVLTPQKTVKVAKPKVEKEDLNEEQLAALESLGQYEQNGGTVIRKLSA